MADKIGVLGEASVVGTGSTSAYVVPSGKAAKCKLMYRGQNAAGAATVDIFVNGALILSTGVLTASHHIWSSTEAQHKANAAAPNGTTKADTCAPGPAEYYLSAGDIVSYTIGTAALSTFNIQIVGAEVDAS